MHPIALLAGAAVVACASSLVIVELVDRPAPPDSPSAPAKPAAADGRVDAISQQLDRIVARLDALESATARRSAPAPAAAKPPQLDDITGESATADASAPKESEAAAVTVDSLMADFAAKPGDYANAQAVWARAREAGLVDDLVAAFESSAQERPNDPDAQCALGGAYLQKLFTVQNDVQKGPWAIKADKAFDAALAINPQHWEARFSKATSLSFWPPIFGKGAEAVHQFETLITQQESSGVSKPEYAQSYVFLGNLYEQQGNNEKAREIWQRGLQHNPQNAELQQRLGH